MFFINWRKNLLLFLYFVLLITSFSAHHQQMCAEFWIQNKDIIGFSSRAVIVVRKRVLPNCFFNLFTLLNKSFHKLITMKLTCFCIKNIAILLMFLLKRLNNQILEIGINIDSLELNLIESIGDTHFNIDISIVTKKHFAETTNVKAPEFSYIDVEHEIVSYEKQVLLNEAKDVSFVQPARNNKPSEPDFVIVSPNQESKLHPSIMKKFYDSLNEKDKRRYAAIESMRIGHGGQIYISQLFACDRKTVRKGIREVENFPRIVKYDSRIRRRRCRRKTASQEDERKLNDAFSSIMDNYKAGNPMNEGQLWTNLSRPSISNKLQEKLNIKIGDHVVKRLLKDNKFGQRKVYKQQTRKSVENRNEQFENIVLIKLEYAESPEISVDSKKKEFLTLYRDGRLYTQKTILCPDHDFPSYSDGSFTPYGIWDIEKNKGFVTIGISNSTAEFACDSIKLWWEREGKIVYPLAKQILILCDGGGNNSSRGYLFKYYLQQLANETGLAIRIAHYPPYCSKYNPIEHRMFPHVTRACQGVIFRDYEQAQEYIEKTHTKTGLTVNAEIIRKEYEKGRKLTTSEIDSINLYRDDFLGKWNYRILPNR
ncbi:Transposase, Rhodopirellula-type [Candidatus Magnetomorum sp. HK-1]|nr:Transposase, Rhodopirellula-type [Candidatus Magnetomorum sp. HK-1]